MYAWKDPSYMENVMLKVICTINFISAKNIAYAKLLKLQYFFKSLKKIQEIA